MLVPLVAVSRYIPMDYYYAVTTFRRANTCSRQQRRLLATKTNNNFCLKVHTSSRDGSPRRAMPRARRTQQRLHERVGTLERMRAQNVLVVVSQHAAFRCHWRLLGMARSPPNIRGKRLNSWLLNPNAPSGSVTTHFLW